MKFTLKIRQQFVWQPRTIENGAIPETKTRKWQEAEKDWNEIFFRPRFQVFSSFRAPRQRNVQWNDDWHNFEKMKIKTSLKFPRWAS